MKALLFLLVLVSFQSMATCSPENMMDENIPAGSCYSDEPQDLSKQCSSDLQVTNERIASSSSCRDAASLAHACAMGSRIDVQFAASAYNVCENELVGMTSREQEELAEMKNDCRKKFPMRSGTLNESSMALCVMDSINFLARMRTMIE